MPPRPGARSCGRPAIRAGRGRRSSGADRRRSGGSPGRAARPRRAGDAGRRGASQARCKPEWIPGATIRGRPANSVAVAAWGVADEQRDDIRVSPDDRGQRLGLAQAQRVHDGVAQLDRGMVQADQDRRAGGQRGEGILQPAQRRRVERAVIVPRHGGIEEDQRQVADRAGVVERRVGGGAIVAPPCARRSRRYGAKAIPCAGSLANANRRRGPTAYNRQWSGVPMANIPREGEAAASQLGARTTIPSSELCQIKISLSCHA